MLGLRTHILRADNIKEVAEYYAKIFQTQPYFENENYIGFNVEGYEFGVFKYFPEEEISVWKNVNIYWWVEDIDTEFQRLSELGMKPMMDDIMDVWEGIKMWDFIDPFGNFFGIINNPNFRA